MDIWIKWCTRRAKCVECGEMITNETPMVMGKLWRKTGEGYQEARRFTLYFRWHPQCWVAQGIAHLPPYDAYYEQRHPALKRLQLQLTEEQRKIRGNLLNKWKVYRYRLRKAVEKQDMEYAAVLVGRMHGIAKEMEDVGGIPSKWIEMLG